MSCAHEIYILMCINVIIKNTHDKKQYHMSAQPLPPAILALQPPQSGTHYPLASVVLPLQTLSVASLKLTASSRPTAPPSSSAKCLRFGHWLSLCTLNMHVLTYLLTYIWSRWFFYKLSENLYYVKGFAYIAIQYNRLCYCSYCYIWFVLLHMCKCFKWGGFCSGMLQTAAWAGSSITWVFNRITWWSCTYCFFLANRLIGCLDWCWLRRIMLLFEKHSKLCVYMIQILDCIIKNVTDYSSGHSLPQCKISLNAIHNLLRWHTVQIVILCFISYWQIILAPNP